MVELYLIQLDLHTMINEIAKQSFNWTSVKRMTKRLVNAEVEKECKQIKS